MTITNANRRLALKAKLSTFAANLLAEWQRLDLPVADASVVGAVSGGADSAALLLAFDELVKSGKLRLKLIVAHLDHGLRKESRQDAEWVSLLAQSLGHEVVTARASLKSGIKKSHKTGASKPEPNLEQAARNARYAFLHQTAMKQDSALVLTGHTLDDQAETILLRLLRGSAAEGLSGILPVRFLTPNSDLQLVRPLLSWARRSETEEYCRLRQVDFRVDEMNDDQAFSRVRVRKQLLPLMKSFNPRIVDALNRTAALLNEDAAALSAAARQLLDSASQTSRQTNETGVPSLSVDVLFAAPAALRRRALREWIFAARGDLRRLEMVHLVAVERLLAGERGGRVAELPGGMKVTRRRGMLELSAKGLIKARATSRIRR